jgi:HD-like signal output (HDOD) protein/CheY-like chemotaxis protein
MSTILVVDDMAIFRDPIAACLQQAGYKTSCAADGQSALASLRSAVPDLILLDVAMPGMDGLTLLKQIRRDKSMASLPVILLTAMAKKELVVQAAELGVRDYLLKSRFSLPELLARVRKLLDAAANAAAGKSAAGLAAGQAVVSGNGAVKSAGGETAVAVKASGGAVAVSAGPGAGDGPPVVVDPDAPQLMTREECLERAQSALQAKSLSGVVAQVIQSAASPHTDAAQIATLISRDPTLSAKLLHVANSAVYASSRGPVTNIADAIKKIGFSTVRNIATTVGIFEAMPAADDGGFDPIRCWQHSFAVAQLCESLAATGKQFDRAIAYLAGLCHDLGEVLVHTRFGKEYRKVLDAHERTKRNLAELERLMLGVTHPELMSIVLDCLGLPPAIREPIESMHAALAAETIPTSAAAKTLYMADRYANGLLLASSERAPLQGLTQADCKAATGNLNAPPPKRDQFRGEVFALTSLLSRLDDPKLSAPLFPMGKKKIFLARESGLCTFDPIEAALGSLGELTVRDRLPMGSETKGTDYVVVSARSSSAFGLSSREIGNALKEKAIPALWLVGQIEDGSGGPDVKPMQWPVPLEVVAKFVQGAS